MSIGSTCAKAWTGRPKAASQADAMFAAAGFAASHHRAGRFALAELTPFYVARAG